MEADDQMGYMDPEMMENEDIYAMLGEKENLQLLLKETLADANFYNCA